MTGALKKHLELLSVFQWVMTFLFFGAFFTSLLFYLLFTRLWAVSVLYFMWWVLDRDTPERGGRRSDWMRRWRVWQHLTDYYPVKLVKTAALPPDRSYVLGSHPHGIMCVGAAAAFCTEGPGFSCLFPGLRPSLALLAGLFRLPLYREYMMGFGMCPVSRPSLDFLLARPGNAVVIVVGGAAESLDCAPGQHRVTLQRRSGFVRLALQHGAALVPVYSFGENEVFRQLIFRPGSRLRHLQLRFKDLTGFAPCLFWGRGPLPFPSPVTVVGEEPEEGVVPVPGPGRGGGSQPPANPPSLHSGEPHPGAAPPPPHPRRGRSLPRAVRRAASPALRPPQSQLWAAGLLPAQRGVGPPAGPLRPPASSAWCGAPGHLAASCQLSVVWGPRAPRGLLPAQRGVGSPGTSRPPASSAWCRAPGHLADSCQLSVV
ncbi:2-acylglycerol O-acyltransferase 3 isoform X1 [Gopherus flavomarginatus]|uniref:2-acylglycerol O-acyltransferase 3 isoform X1 n=1 Tax=Gopherus flavomarginatus TaxID=286002 RepID=UPI0021CBA2B4|nr:2-acylglycerol O-acyltransferase 3 isoform X1 [Gopherus flavomarginatus]